MIAAHVCIEVAEAVTRSLQLQEIRVYKDQQRRFNAVMSGKNIVFVEKVKRKIVQQKENCLNKKDLVIGEDCHLSTSLSVESDATGSIRIDCLRSKFIAGMININLCNSAYTL